MDHRTSTMSATEAEEAWSKWKHPFNITGGIHPRAPNIDINSMLRNRAPGLQEVILQASFEEGNYISLTREDLELPPRELQELISDDERGGVSSLSLDQLHMFCGKPSACYNITSRDWEKEPRGRRLAVLHRVYGEWFKLVPCNTVETRFFTRYLTSKRILGLDRIIRAHKVLYEQLEQRMRQPVERDPEPHYGYSFAARNVHHLFSLLPLLRDLVVIIDKEASLDPALLVVLQPGLTEGVKRLEGIKQEERELDGEKSIIVRMGMEDIMQAVVEIQKRAEERGPRGISGTYSNWTIPQALEG